MKNNVVVFDLDGTLINGKNEIIGGTQTLQCLKVLELMNCTLAICTGRLDHDIIQIAHTYELNMKHRISQNGAVIYHDDHCDALLLDQTEGLQVYEYMKHFPVRIELNTISNRYWKSERDEDFPKELYDSHIISQDYEAVLQHQPVVLFLVVGELEHLSKIANYVEEQFQHIKAVMTSNTSLEILNKKASKGHAIEVLYPDCNVYAIGDSPNDIDMFPVAKKGYLVSDIECEVSCIKKPTILEAFKDIIERIEVN